jgi:phosphatidylserine/phosphatidylglycerophosphate/cardiolipin synthase-like enzyme
MLILKHREGADVGVLVDKSPAGGMDENEKSVLCSLSAAGVKVFAYEGPLTFMHAKYAVSDGSVSLVTSENIGYAGFTPDADYGNRGWGAVVYDSGISGQLTEIFGEDVEDSVPFACSMKNYSLSAWDPAGAYRPKFRAEAFGNQKVSIISSPDSLDSLLGIIKSANSSIAVEQFYIYEHWGSARYDTDQTAPSPLLTALIEKARGGVTVRILLDSTYYNMDRNSSVSNYYTIRYVNDIAAREKIPIQAKAIGLDKRGLAMLHNKGVVVDNGIALVSSINWNENSVMKNREIGVVIEGNAAEYYAGVFDDDWADAGGENRGGDFTLAMISLAFLIIMMVLILYFGRRKIKSPVDI